MKTTFFSFVILLGAHFSTGTSTDLQDATKLKAVVGHLMQLPKYVKEYMCEVIDIVTPHIKDDEMLKQALSTVKVQLRTPTRTMGPAYGAPSQSSFGGFPSYGGPRRSYSLDSPEWKPTLNFDTDKYMNRISNLIDKFTNRVNSITDERIKLAEESAKIRYGDNKSA